MQPDVQAFFDEATNTVSYVAFDGKTRMGAIIDSVLDFDQASGRTHTKSADQIIAYVREADLHITHILETHVHADHLSAAPYLKDQLGGQIAIGAEIITVQDVFGKVFNEGTEFERNGSQFDVLFHDGDTFDIGAMRVQVLHTLAIRLRA